MAKHNETGLKGEQIAENFLLKKGYNILHKNHRFEKKEIDIIAQKDDILVFAEVKTRKSFYYGFPEEYVTLKKQDFMKQAALAYTAEHTEYSQIRFDVISIQFDRDKVKEIVHFKDAFY